MKLTEVTTPPNTHRLRCLANGTVFRFIQPPRCGGHELTGMWVKTEDHEIVSLNPEHLGRSAKMDKIDIELEVEPLTIHEIIFSPAQSP